MTKPRAEVALLRLMKAVERGPEHGGCTAEEAYECFMLGYGGDKSVYFRTPQGLKAEMSRIPVFAAEVRGRFVRFVLSRE